MAVITILASSTAFMFGLAVNAPEKLKPASIVADFHNTCIPSIRDSLEVAENRFKATGFKLIPNWTTASWEHLSFGYSKEYRDSGYVTLVSEPISSFNPSMRRCTMYASSGDAASIRRSMITVVGSVLKDSVLDGNRTMTWVVDTGETQFSLQFVEYTSNADSQFSLTTYR